MKTQDLCDGRRAAELLDNRLCRFHRDGQCSDIRYHCKSAVSIPTTDERSDASYDLFMKHLTIAQWVRAAIDSKKISQAELSRRLQVRLRRSYDRSMVYKILKGERDVSAAELVAIEQITGFRAPTQLSPNLLHVPVIPWTAAGALADPALPIPTEDNPLITVADLDIGEYFALRVEGDSMDRVSPPGSVILINRADRLLSPNRFYLFAARGVTTYRRWHDKPPYLAPLSTSSAHEPTFLNRPKDAEVIGRVRRTLLDL
jgi:SOS-response transcriptional repressor LexA